MDLKLPESSIVHANAVTDLLVSNDAYLAGSTCRHLWKNLTCLSLLKSLDAAMIVFVYILLWKAVHPITSGSEESKKKIVEELR